jgi:copper chaperone CopZ
MLVKDVIEQLQKLPPDVEVYAGQERRYYLVESVEQDPEDGTALINTQW